MNEIRRPLREADEMAQLRSIIACHALPPFTTGFNLRMGEFNDVPALWIPFVLTKDLAPGDSDADARLDATTHAIDEIRDDVLTQQSDRYPYFTFELPQSV